MIAQQTEAAIRNAKKETAAQASALARQNRDAAAKESDDISLIGKQGAPTRSSRRRSTSSPR
jgi:hypothetical protein